MRSGNFVVGSPAVLVGPRYSVAFGRCTPLRERSARTPQRSRIAESPGVRPHRSGAQTPETEEEDGKEAAL